MARSMARRMSQALVRPIEWASCSRRSSVFGSSRSDVAAAVPVEGSAHATFNITRPDSPWVFCHKDGSPIRDVRKSFGSTCRKAGIDDFHPHDLRHTCAAWLVQQGVPIRDVSELLRHSDIRITMRYAHLAPENVRRAVTKLESMTVPSSHCSHTGARERVVKVV